MTSSTLSLTGISKRDLYCWICHMETPLLKCRKCPRSYHRHCVYENMPNYPEPIFHPESSTPNLIDECPECIVAKKTTLPHMKDVGKEELKRILLFVTKNLKNGYYWPNPYYKLDVSSRFKDVVAKFMDIFTLEAMVMDYQFHSLEGFLGDAKWILHNCIVYKGRTSKEVESANEIMRICKLELMAVDLCPECYCREQNRDADPYWFTKACHKRPHVLGWAKVSGANYWPVKIMQSRGPALVTVRAFADYRRYDVDPNDCFMFSSNPPEKVKEKRKDAYLKAMAEVKIHLGKLVDVFERVELAEEKTPLGLMSLDDARGRMFPDIKSKAIARTNPRK